MATTQKIKTTCTKCGGTGRYDAPTCYPGGCFACNGTGYFLTDQRTVARRDAREQQAEAQAVKVRKASLAVTETLMSAWEDEFAHIDPEYRHMHVTEKARRILWQDHHISIRCTAEIARHLPLLGLGS